MLLPMSLDIRTALISFPYLFPATPHPSHLMQPLLFHSLLSPVTAQPQSKLTCSNYKSTTTKITLNVSGSLGLIFEAWPSTLLGPRPPRTESEHIDRSWEEVPAGRGLSRLQSQLSARSRDPVSTLRQLPPWYRGESRPKWHGGRTVQWVVVVEDCCHITGLKD